MNLHLVSILPDEHMESKDKQYKDQNSNIKRSSDKREVASQ
jgi:hypothetical protein